MSAATIGSRHHVVIVGCGFGGLFAAKTLRRAEVDVTVIDRTNHHLFQPLLYQVATGILSEGDIAPPIRDVLRHQRNTRVVLGEVIGIDLDACRVTEGVRSVSLRQIAAVQNESETRGSTERLEAGAAGWAIVS